MNKANIFVKHPNNKGVYLYTATKGQSLPKTLQRALIRGRERWGDTPALTRIIFSEMIQTNVLDKTGFAISPTLADNEHWILVVDDRQERLGVFTEAGACLRHCTFDEYCGIPEKDLEWNRLMPNKFLDDYSESIPNRPDLYKFP